MKKKFLYLILSLIFIIFNSFFGCIFKSNDSNKVVIWHWMTDRETVFIELANKYKELYGTEIVFELYAPSESYLSKVKAAAQTNTLPDVFSVLGGKRDFISFINSGYIANLKDDMDLNNKEWENSFFDSAINMSKFEKNNIFNVPEGIYGVPLDLTYIQLVYNKDLFKKAGIDTDNIDNKFLSWKEFLELSTKLKAANIQRFVSGFSEVWLLDCLASMYAYNILGEEKYMATIKGDVPYTDPDWVKVLTLFAEMRDNDMFAVGTISMINKTAESNFSTQRAAISFDGTWCVNVYEGMNPNLNYGVILPPVIDSNKDVAIWGGAGAILMVNNKSTKKAKAIKFLKWLTSTEQQVYLSETTNNLPANKNSVIKIKDNLKMFVENLDKLKVIHPYNYKYTEYPSVTEVFDKGIQSIIINEKTPIEVLSEVQRVKEKEMNNEGK